MNAAKVIRDVKKNANGWFWISLMGAAVILLPIFSILASLFKPTNENWAHIQEFLLKDYALQTVWLLLGTGIATLIVGTGLAWLVSAYDFIGKRFFRFAFILPLAIPPYIAAYTYSTMFDYTGVVQKTLRDWFGYNLPPDLIDIRSLPGAILIFTLFLFPYVYMITRSFLERQSGTYIENARLLGRSPAAIFFRVVLPMARPAIIGGVSLVLFEVVSDYGVTSYFGVHTITTAIFQTWFGLYDADSAVRLAAFLMAGIVGAFLIERLLRARRRYSASTSKSRPLVQKRLRGLGHAAALLICGLVVAVSFLIPVLQLITWAWLTYQDVLTAQFIELTFNTLRVALLATAIILVISTTAANVNRVQRNRFTVILTKLLTAGYSIPGAILAIGVLTLFLWLDQQVIAQFGTGQLVLSMTLLMLIVAYVVRFMATGFQAVEAGFEKIGHHYMEASRMLGHGLTKTFFKVDLPLIKGALLTGTVLTFVEIVKELPLALLLRPFNFETLATKTYQYANDEMIQEAAVPALFIIAVSLLAVAVIHRVGERTER